jgi:hypothetical protein
MIASQNFHILAINIKVELTYLLRADTSNLLNFALFVEERTVPMQFEQASLKDEFILEEEEFSHYVSDHKHGVLFD